MTFTSFWQGYRVAYYKKKECQNCLSDTVVNQSRCMLFWGRLLPIKSVHWFRFASFQESGHLSYQCPKNVLGEREPPPKKQKKLKKNKGER